MAPRTALIVGAGVGGLAAAVALRKAGWQVRVFERAAQARELGFALNLAPNAMAALRELGVAEPLLAEGAPPGDAEMRADGGRRLRRLTVPVVLDRVQSVVALRPVLHGALMTALGPEPLELSREAVAVRIDGTRAVLRLKDGDSIAGDVIVGADGVGSIIRRQLHPHEGPPRRSGYYAVRGVAHDAEHLLGTLSAIAYLARGLEAATVRAGHRAIYWYMSLLATDVAAGEPIDTLVERFGALLDDQFRAIARATRREDLRFDELFDRDPIDGWGTGPVTLLGDAAHPMLPHAGQGAAQALEDAVALGLALAAADEVDSALRRYERVRSARTRKIVTRARRIARTTTTKSALVGWVREAGAKLVPARMLLSAFYLSDASDPHRALR
jgi:2-polyprenyl-6-methoxyphenol hydroxylase-like FAD-dependent oxidoreductase